MRIGVPRWGAILARWTLGMALVSWRYLWATTPLHRSVEAGDASDLPPPVPGYLADGRSQPAERGVGRLFHRVFTVEADRPSLTPPELISRLVTDLNRAVPAEVTSVERLPGAHEDLAVGDELVVHIPGPWDGPVRVVDRSDASFRFATLTGHLEAGQIEFRAHHAGTTLRFQIEAWARPSSRLVSLLYTHLRLAKEIQLNMWVRFCLNAAHLAGGRVHDGVTIHTRAVPAPRDKAALDQRGERSSP